MKVLVTGATGFVGRATCQALHAAGHVVRIALRSDEACLPPCDEAVIVGDVHASTDWSAPLAGIDCVLHLAARVHVMREQVADPLSEFRRVNTEGTLRLARLASEAGVRRFVFLSSIKVNGENTVVAFRETDVPRPADAYARSKWEAEQGLMAIAAENAIEMVVIRPPLVYGPGVKGNFAALIGMVERGLPLPFGAVRNQRSFVALENLVDFICRCTDDLATPSIGNNVFIIADGQDCSTAELLMKIAHAYGRPCRLLPIPVGLLLMLAWLVGKGSEARRLFGSLQVCDLKARTMLGWKPVVTMDEQLKRMADDAARP